MAGLNLGTLISDMTAAVKAATEEDWNKLTGHIEEEVLKLSRLAVRIEAQHLAGQITDAEARALLKGAKIASRIALRSAAGVQKVIAEKAINAATGILAGAVNTALGFTLL